LVLSYAVNYAHAVRDKTIFTSQNPNSIAIATYLNNHIAGFIAGFIAGIAMAIFQAIFLCSYCNRSSAGHVAVLTWRWLLQGDGHGYYKPIAMAITGPWQWLLQGHGNGYHKAMATAITRP
jgi:hypothetical protein